MKGLRSVRDKSTSFQGRQKIFEAIFEAKGQTLQSSQLYVLRLLQKARAAMDRDVRRRLFGNESCAWGLKLGQRTRDTRDEDCVVKVST